LLMLMRSSRHWQTCLTASLSKSSGAGFRIELRDWNTSSDTMENTLLNGWSKSFWFGRAAEIGGGVITFCTPYITIRVIHLLTEWLDRQNRSLLLSHFQTQMVRFRLPWMHWKAITSSHKGRQSPVSEKCPDQSPKHREEMFNEVIVICSLSLHIEWTIHYRIWPTFARCQSIEENLESLRKSTANIQCSGWYCGLWPNISLKNLTWICQFPDQ
jgi:hypothetical protein